MYVEVVQRNVIDTHQRVREIIAITLGVVLLTTPSTEVGCSRFLPYLRGCDHSPATTLGVYESVHRDIIMNTTNEMQLYRLICYS